MGITTTGKMRPPASLTLRQLLLLLNPSMAET